MQETTANQLNIGDTFRLSPNGQMMIVVYKDPTGAISYRLPQASDECVDEASPNTKILKIN
jgi:serine protease inhibitor ecotin